MRKLIIVLGLALAAGCASQPEELSASHISDLKYRDYTCRELAAELSEVETRRDELFASLKTDADNDVAQTAIGIVLFWPALFLLEGGDGHEAEEYKRLKGEAIALDKAQTKKGCVFPDDITPTDEEKKTPLLDS